VGADSSQAVILVDFLAGADGGLTQEAYTTVPEDAAIAYTPIAVRHDRPSDKVLFTPGPLTTSRAVKEAMLRDLGSRDTEFIELVREVRGRLLALAEVGPPDYQAVIVQGSGTFGVESALSTAVPRGGTLLVLVNGAYGKRMAAMARVLGIPLRVLETPEDTPHDPAAVDAFLARDPAITAVAVVHCETTTGLMNPVREIGQAARRRGCIYLVDAMSSFGAVPIPAAEWEIDFLVSSSNKCIEGVPGFSFVIARRDRLAAAEGQARSLSLDLFAQWRGLEDNGQFRFTPPVQALLAFHRALLELEEEGGVTARGARYRENNRLLRDGMRALGFREYLRPEVQGIIITSFLDPEHPKFSFEEFYRRLSDRGQVIYPGKLSHADCFRIGNIGRIYPRDIEALLEAVRSVREEMGFHG
jgi:2-aminoethylphosphonate-pyruvate transaminase